MLGLVIRRLGSSIVLLFIVLSLTFFLLHLGPGDPVDRLLDPRISAAQREALRETWGLELPLPQQYLHWLRSVTLHGDWGTSFTRGQAVSRVIADHLPNSLLLGFAAILVQYSLGILLGVTAARRAHTPLDHWIRGASLTLYSLPVFWLGLIALLLFHRLLPVFPAGDIRSLGAESWTPAVRAVDRLWHLCLPALVLGGTAAGGTARFVRNSLLDVLGQPFAQAARARGVSDLRLLWVHALRHAATPLSQILGLSLPFLLSGALVTEVVFSWNGVGRVAHAALLARDYPLILGTTALVGTLVVTGNFLADLLQAAVDPRVRDA